VHVPAVLNLPPGRLEHRVDLSARLLLGVEGVGSRHGTLNRITRGPQRGAPWHLRARAATVPPYSGMFPCFRTGLASRLFFSMSSALARRGRVSRGSITSST